MITVIFKGLFTFYKPLFLQGHEASAKITMKTLSLTCENNLPC